MNLKRKIDVYLVKHRKKVRTIKALAGVFIFVFLKYVLKLDVDAMFIAAAFWGVNAIKW